MNQLILESKLNKYSKEELVEIFAKVVPRIDIQSYLLEINKKKDFIKIEKLEQCLKDKTPKPKKEINRSLYNLSCDSCGGVFNWDSCHFSKSNRKYRYCIKCQVDLSLKADL